MNAAVLVSVLISTKQRGYRASAGGRSEVPAAHKGQTGVAYAAVSPRPHVWTRMWTAVYPALSGSASDYIGSEM
jgi:hypothetical protein